MLKNALFVTLLALMVGGCASDGKMESSGTSSSMSSSGSEGAARSSTEAPSSTPAMSGGSAAESSSMNRSSSRNRVAAGVEEETLDTCLARIPKDATAGQKMLAEQTCQREYATRR